MKIWNEVWDYIKMFIIVIVVVLVVNNVVLINAKIPSESMEQTIMTGDRIFGFRETPLRSKTAKSLSTAKRTKKQTVMYRKHRPAIMVRTLCRRDAISCLVITASIPRIPDSGAIRS